MDKELKENLKRGATWVRVLYMLLLAIFYMVAETVLCAVVIIQVFFTLIKGTPNERLLDFGAALSKYVYQVLMYLTYNSEEKPYPFSDWPEGDG